MNDQKDKITIVAIIVTVWSLIFLIQGTTQAIPKRGTSSTLIEIASVEGDELVGRERIATTQRVSSVLYHEPTPEIATEDIILLARLVMAEAGNQDLMGKRLVVDVVLNRLDSAAFPNTVREVICQRDQFTVVESGAWDRAQYTVTEECFEAVLMEYNERTDQNVMFFSKGKADYMVDPFKHGDHWFGRMG